MNLHGPDISPYPSFIYPELDKQRTSGLLFDLATGWLMQHRIILPGATTLTRLISEVGKRRRCACGTNWH
ncbi:DUF4158 domain-containing protein [Klebsiella pneumoniae]